MISSKSCNDPVSHIPGKRPGSAFRSTINPSNPVDPASHDRMVSLIKHMLVLNKKLQDASLGQEKTLLSR
jgi:hypothetical protein